MAQFATFGPGRRSEQGTFWDQPRSSLSTTEETKKVARVLTCRQVDDLSCTSS